MHMAQQKKSRNFLQEAIKGLSKEEFDELVRKFQLSYLHYDEIVFVDGTNDGGCDIKIFQNKKEVKKCVQITTQKQIERKLKQDLTKVSNMISRYGYSYKFDFFCSIPLSDEKIEEYKKNAIDTYDIELDIYEAKRLAQLNCPEVVDYIYSLHSDVILKPEQMNVDRAKKTLYDLLANGKDSSDIKNSFVDSVIISILYEKAPMEISVLKDELEHRLGKNIPDILHLINNLKSDQRVIKDIQNDKLLRLSEDEFTNVQEILTFAAKLEKDFCTELTTILSKYQISYTSKVLDELKKLYKIYYSNDIDFGSKKDETIDVKILENLKKYLSNLIDNKDDIDALIEDIHTLCEHNNYLNKISASESFLSLYKSNRLELYLNQKKKDIYLDTPTFVYLLCNYYGIERNDWDNPFYRSMKSLIKLRDTYPQKISFYITQNYLGEVEGEIQKALQYAKFEKYPFFKDLGETSNTLYNYYNYLKNAELFEVGDEITSFDEFMYVLGLDNTNPNDDKFYKNTMDFLYEVAENYEIEIVDWTPKEKYNEIKESYEKILLSKNRNKSETAIRNDVDQVITLLEDDSTDIYFTTWDTTIHLLRDKILDTQEHRRYHYFNIYNPARLSNKIALENFNIDESAVTNEIFAYADKKYDISNRVKSLLEIITPFLKNDAGGNNKLLKKLARIRKTQLHDSNPMKETTNDNKNLPIEEIIMMLIPNKERVQQDSYILEKFSTFMSMEENTDYIIDLIQDISQMKDYKQFDFTEYFNKVGSIDLFVDKENE